MAWLKQHIVLLVVLGILVAGGIWWGMSSGAPAAPLVTTTLDDTGSPTTDSADKDVVESLLTLRAIDLKGAIFTDDSFKILHDFGTMIVPEPQGRENPFAAIGQRSQAVTAPDYRNNTPASNTTTQ